jgi:hypothetical protein
MSFNILPYTNGIEVNINEFISEFTTQKKQWVFI